MRYVKVNESTASRRRVYFQLVDVADGITPANGEAGRQPQISTNGSTWTDTGIGTLTLIGNGRYYADLTQAAVGTAGDIIEARYKRANTAECPGDSLHVWYNDPAQLAFATMGSGTTPTTITINDGSNPLDSADVWISTDSAGANVIARGNTDDNGQVTFLLDVGTYYVWAQHAGYSALGGQTLTVS